MSKALEKYNVPLKTRVRVPATSTWEVAQASVVTVKESEGRVLEVVRAPSATVSDKARLVIAKHNEVIKRLAKR
ncbi:hypothetical protein [Cupriavidus sp. AU9028]|uniref:hypothetical protein n=1 Tax=Cupriavidus sp. AU9028 TaxID=2871157 RepID=UPI001C97AC6B|nr:hypothetical protein [Cupriavidus sp. AU9028]MBY4895812.1 hypothetical protein [Cupriavidus sp. AU9028]